MHRIASAWSAHHLRRGSDTQGKPWGHATHARGSKQPNVANAVLWRWHLLQGQGPADLSPFPLTSSMPCTAAGEGGSISITLVHHFVNKCKILQTLENCLVAWSLPETAALPRYWLHQRSTLNVRECAVFILWRTPATSSKGAICGRWPGETTKLTNPRETLPSNPSRVKGCSGLRRKAPSKLQAKPPFLKILRPLGHCLTALGHEMLPGTIFEL